METEEIYVLDTIGFISHLLGTLPKRLNDIFEKAQTKECKMILPSISIGEAIYIFLKAIEREGMPTKENLLWEMFDRLERGAYIQVEDLDFKDWKAIAKLPYRDLHDRMVVVKALRYKATLITNDREIVESKIVKTMW